MKIRAHNELVFTVFFGKENASERMREIFTDVYGDINKAFTSTEPNTTYGSIKGGITNESKRRK